MNFGRENFQVDMRIQLRCNYLDIKMTAFRGIYHFSNWKKVFLNCTPWDIVVK